MSEKKSGTEHKEAVKAAQVKPADKGKKASGPGPDYPRYRIAPNKKVNLSKVDPDETEHYTDEESGLKDLEEQRQRISELQERLFAEEKRSLLVVLQAMDAGGKDGVGRGVFRGINPQGCNVWSFKEASDDEAKHDFLWRYHQKVPEAGMIGLFNRSYYEQVLSARVKGEVPEEVWHNRYKLINDFEQMLSHEGVTVLKFFLHVSKDEQKRRLEERLENPRKYWLFSENDVKERERWDEHMEAFEDAINNCSTKYAPWYVVPGNKKWFRNLVIARSIADTLEEMDPQFPPLDKKYKDIKIK
jgi:PPK2 family polyphosphate:nucleotide phosphotransferase